MINTDPKSEATKVCRLNFYPNTVKNPEILVPNWLLELWILVLSWEEKRKAGSTCPQNKIRPLASVKWIKIHSTFPFLWFTYVFDEYFS